MPTLGPQTPAAVGVDVREEAAATPSPVASNEYVANTFGEYVRGQWQKIRGGDAGVLPVIVGFIIIVIVFQLKDSNFLTARNLVDLFDAASLFIIFGMGELFILLLGEIDLSVGFNGGVGAAVIAELVAPPDNHSWIVAVLAGVGVCMAIGLVQGVLVTRFGVPAFIVTLAGYLGLQGLILFIFEHDKNAVGGAVNTNTNGFVTGIISNRLSPTAGWIVVIVAIALVAVVLIGGNFRRRRSGLSAPPLPVTLLKIVLLAAAAVVVILICNTNQSLLQTATAPKLEGMPYVVLVVVGMLLIYTFMLDRTRFGRYIYAIGGNPEAARRAGIRVKTVRTACFVLAGFTAGIGGLVADSYLGGGSSNFDGGQYVLYAVAAAVIGGTSLFGGRGRMFHAVLGGLVIAGIANGMNLLGLTAAAQEIVNALVLLAAVLIDALTRRGRTVR